MALPTRTASDTPESHLADHNLLHRKYNLQTKHARRSVAGNVSLTTGTWTAIDASGLDLVLTTPAAGDVVEFSLSTLWSSSPSEGAMDVATMDGSTPINYFSTGTSTPATYGVAGWYGPGGIYCPVAGSVAYVLVAGDIISGSVTLRVFGKIFGGTAKTVYASSDGNFQVFAKNHGPGTP